MSRKLGEQWVEEIDGKKHMLKAVPSVGIGACTACDFEGQESKCVGFPNSVCGSNSNSFIIKDLGVLNEDGCLAEERTGLFPVIAGLESVKCWIVRLNAENVTITVVGATKQQAIDAWNRRAL